MIVTGKVSLVKTAYHLRWRLLTVLVTSLLVCIVYEGLNNKDISIQITPITALGVAIGLFLGFRSNVVWDRYWEARTLWGRLINSSRTFSRQLEMYVTGAERAAFHREMSLRLAEYVKSLCCHLRDEDINDFNKQWSDEHPGSRTPSNLPAAFLHRMGERLHEAWRDGRISDFHLTRLDETLTEITDMQGGCERIKNTPIPPAFTYLSHRVMQAYCFLIPFGLVSDLHWFTPVVTLLVSFAFLILDEISDLIEQPFAREDNDLPLDQMTRLIEIDLRERIGETDIPPPITPKDGILL